MKTAALLATRDANRSGKSQAAENALKHFCLDTNVLIGDPKSIFQFEDNHVFIPVEVIEELDAIKKEMDSARGRNAREVTRVLAEFFPDSVNMEEGVRLPNGGTLSVVIRPKNFKLSPKASRVLADPNKPDNKIIACALYLAATFPPPVLLVSKDVNVQLKARAAGLHAEDYLSDHVDVAEDDLTILDIDGHAMQRFASTGELDFETGDLYVNEYLLLRDADTGKTMPARATAATHVVRLNIPDAISAPGCIPIRPRNLEQSFFVDALLNPDISLVAVQAKAGTGKTLLSTAAALSQVLGNDNRYNQALISRAVIPIGRDLGALPGDQESKMMPWVMPFVDAIDFLMPPRKPVDPQFANKPVGKKNRRDGVQHQNGNGQDAYSSMKPSDRLLKSGIVTIQPITYVRGRSFARCIFVVDECQNLSPLEVKTLVTRIAEGSKMILIGDPAQVDSPWLNQFSNGLVHLISRLRGERAFATLTLRKGERSALAELAATKL